MHHLRPSRIDAAKQAAAILKLLVRRLRQAGLAFWYRLMAAFNLALGFGGFSLRSSSQFLSRGLRGMPPPRAR